jgi:eukaryotic-like serine/threonine-protein kinase
MFADLPARYVPDGRYATGGFGSVSFCDDAHLERKVAIKMINDGAERRRISDEVRALLQLRSKHVVQVYDVVVSRTGQIGIVQEFIEGEDLSEAASPRESNISYMAALWQVASGISDIHAAGIIHRDIKPNNIKISAERIIKIFDFGLAREDGPAARTVGFVGTRGFAAPEQLVGGMFTRAVDTYAFGATALFIANQNLPADLLALPPTQPVSNPFLNLPFELEEEVSSLLYQCLAANPADRPQMDAVKNLLAKHLLFNRHQALAVYPGGASYLNSDEPLASLEFPGVGKLDIQYDGLAFKVANIEGEVYINNDAYVVGEEIPGSCVVALGSPARRANDRVFITFDVSYPEVVL